MIALKIEQCNSESIFMIVFEYDGVEKRVSSLPLMTIAMIMYNRKEYVKAAVESLLQQDYPNLEIIISDDNSDDGALEIALEIVKRYKGGHRIVFNVNERNLGLGGNFAKVLSLSHGEWVVACGGDDVQHNDRVSRVLHYVREYPSAVVIGSGANTIDQYGTVTGEQGVTAPFLYKKYNGGKLLIASANTAVENATLSVAAGACAAYHKDLCGLLLFPSGVWCEDLVMDLRGIQYGDILFVPDKLVDYRVHRQSVCSGGNKARRRGDRRKFRYRISMQMYSSVKAALNEAVKLQGGWENGFVDTLCCETAKSLIWSFNEGEFSKKVSLYVSAYKVARKRFSFLTLMRGAEGRGVLWSFLTVAFRSLFYPACDNGMFLQKLDMNDREEGNL